MASYDDLDQLIVELKIARINAWMRSKGWKEGGATHVELVLGADPITL